jgi:hypothetical protein
MIPARILIGRRSMAIGVGRDLCPVPTQVHAAPDACAFLTRDVKVKDTAITFSNARYRRGRQQISKRIREGCERMFGNFWSKIRMALRPGLGLNDLVYVGICDQQPVDVPLPSSTPPGGPAS